MHSEARELGLDLEDLQNGDELDKPDEPDEQEDNPDGNKISEDVDHASDASEAVEVPHKVDHAPAPSPTQAETPRGREQKLKEGAAGPKETTSPAASIIADTSEDPVDKTPDAAASPKRKGRRKGKDEAPGSKSVSSINGKLSHEHTPNSSSSKAKGKNRQAGAYTADPEAEAERITRVVEDVQNKSSKLREKWGNDWTSEQKFAGLI